MCQGPAPACPGCCSSEMPPRPAPAGCVPPPPRPVPRAGAGAGRGGAVVTTAATSGPQSARGHPAGRTPQHRRHLHHLHHHHHLQLLAAARPGPCCRACRALQRAPCCRCHPGRMEERCGGDHMSVMCPGGCSSPRGACTLAVTWSLGR